MIELIGPPDTDLTDELYRCTIEYNGFPPGGKIIKNYEYISFLQRASKEVMLDVAKHQAKEGDLIIAIYSDGAWSYTRWRRI